MLRSSTSLERGSNGDAVRGGVPRARSSNNNDLVQHVVTAACRHHAFIRWRWFEVEFVQSVVYAQRPMSSPRYAVTTRLSVGGGSRWRLCKKRVVRAHPHIHTHTHRIMTLTIDSFFAELYPDAVMGSSWMDDDVPPPPGDSIAPTPPLPEPAVHTIQQPWVLGSGEAPFPTVGDPLPPPPPPFPAVGDPLPSDWLEGALPPYVDSDPPPAPAPVPDRLQTVLVGHTGYQDGNKERIITCAVHFFSLSL